MADVTKLLEPAGDVFGIKVVDVRFKRVDFPQQNSEAVYNRMRTQRAQEATRIRAEGQARAQEIRAQADRDRTVLLANTQRDAQILRGAGRCRGDQDLQRGVLRDPEFFDLYRSLQAMRTGLSGNNTTFVGSPTGDFFRYFEQNARRSGKAPQQ